MSTGPTFSRLSVVWATLGLALVRLITGRSSTREGVSNSAPKQNLPGSGKPADLPAAELRGRNWKAFLKRDVGWGFGILFLLAMMQAAFFAYDQILNDSALETAAVNTVSQQWQMLRTR